MPDVDALTDLGARLLRLLDYDPDSPGLQGTPRRWAQAWAWLLVWLWLKHIWLLHSTSRAMMWLIITPSLWAAMAA